jgi:hypothetical protein
LDHSNDARGIGRRAVLMGGAQLATAAAALSAAPAMAAAAKVGQDDPLFKCTEFVKRKASLTPEDFHRHWTEVLAPMIRQMPGLVRMSFNVVDRSLAKDALYDAAIQTWYRDEAAYKAAFGPRNQPLLGRIIADGKLFMEPDYLGMFTHEVVIRADTPGAPPPLAKRIGLVGRAPDMSQQDFFQIWRDEQAIAVNDQFGLQRYILNMVRGDRYASAQWDGYAELAWTDWAAQKDASKTASKVGGVAGQLLLQPPPSAVHRGRRDHPWLRAAP